MNRAEMRRMKREQQKSHKTYNLNHAQISDIKKQATDDAVRTAFILMFGLPLMALRDKFGYGKMRLERFSDALFDLYDSFEKGYFTIDDINKTIYEETGMRIEEVRKK